MSLTDAILNTEKFSEWITLQTNASKKCLNRQLNEWTYDAQRLVVLSNRFKRFKAEFQSDPLFFVECHKIFKEISEIEKKLDTVINTDSKLEKESYNELLFFRPILQPLNFLPFVLSLWSLLRVYILPGLSFLVPFITLLAPYFVLKFIFSVPITFNNYMNILHSMVSGNFGKVMDPSANISAPAISPVAFIKQFGIVLVTFVQGIIQPYWSYKHLKSIDNIVKDNGQLVIKFRDLYERLQTILSVHGFTFFKCPLPEIRDEREAAARAILDSSYFKMALKYIGSLEVIMCLANKEGIQPVKWIKSATPVFKASHTFDFQVPENLRKTVSAEFNKNQNALLTGPNKGGKSTVLRALSLSALLAHTYGCAPGQLVLTPFSRIFVCLKPDDLPGSKSRFEREIEFTANTLKSNEPIIVLIDELYHSTNPPDALRSCQIYCNKLWNKSNVISVISTHLFELVEKADAHVQRLCCPATIDDKGDIHFEYTLNTGICKVSSVDELLRSNGLDPR